MVISEEEFLENAYEVGHLRSPEVEELLKTRPSPLQIPEPRKVTPSPRDFRAELKTPRKPWSPQR